MSLRARLLLGLVVLVIIGLVVADIATYESLQSALIGRVDAQLRQSEFSVSHYLLEKHGFEPGPGHGAPAPLGLPIGTYGQLRSPTGTVLESGPIGFGNSTPSSSKPQLPASLTPGSQDSPAIWTVAGTGGVSEYRVLAYVDKGDGHGDTVIIAVPLTEVASTLQQLLILEFLIGLGVLAGMTLLAWFIIRLGLRPLERMEATAEAIAAGDLSQRVAPATTRTEVGRLGIALNTMLAQIESAFAERTESERRLRRFVADASHELRTPLTSIRGYAELFRRGAAARPSEVALSMRRIEDEATRMGVLVDDLLLLARLDQGRPLERDPVDITTVVGDACTDARAVDPGRDIVCETDGPVIVSGDEPRLRQVVGNLLRNALVHTPPATPVQVSAAALDGLAIVVVSDHGPGLPPGQADRIFEPFYRADPARSRDRGGTGLGLSIVARVVAAHGGTVHASRTPGGGATFRVELPLADSGGPRTQPAPAPANLAAG